MTISLGGCETFRAAAPTKRTLPPESNVVLEPAPRPRIRPGDDARVAWKKEEARADENEKRLVRSRQIYRGVRLQYEK